MQSSVPHRALAAIWFADIVGYTALSADDERKALRLVNLLQTVTKSEVARFGGRVVKFVGDAALAEFSSTDAAVRAALSVRRRFESEATAIGSHGLLRVGIHVGDVVKAPDGDIYGDGVNVASRLQAHADPGRVLVSEDVWRQLRPRTEYRFDARGERELKGITARVAVFDVELGEEVPQPELPAATTTRSAFVTRFSRPHFLVAALAATLVVVSAYGWFASRPIPLSFEIGNLTRVTTEGGASIAALSPDGQYVAHDKRAEERATLWIRQRATTRDVQIVGPEHDRFLGVSFSRDGAHLYYVAYDSQREMGELFRVPTLGGTSIRLVEDVDTAVGLSPDGRRFAFVRGEPATGRSHLMLAQHDGSDVRSLLSLSAEKSFAFVKPSWSPDGRTLLAVVAANGRQTPYVVDVATGEMLEADTTWVTVNSLEWLSESQSFVVSASRTFGENPQVWQVQYPSKERRRITNDLNGYSLVSLSEDSTSLMTLQAETIAGLWVVPLTGAARPLLMSRRDDGVYGLAWSPSNQIVFQSNRLGSRQLWSIDPDGSNLRQLTDGPDAGFPASSPDGRSIVYGRSDPDGNHVWHTLFDGSPPTQLTATMSLFPVVCRDGWVYYVAPDELAFGGKSYRTRLEGGASEPLPVQFFVADCFPDGSLLGYTWNVEQRRNYVARLSHADLELIGDFPGSGSALTLRVVPGKNAISFTMRKTGNSEVWMVSKDQAAPTQITRSGSDDVLAYDWSPDGTQMVVARGRINRDVVIMERK